MAVGRGESVLCTFQPALQDPVGLDCVWKIPIWGLFQLIQMHLQEMHFECHCCFPLLQS